VKTRQNKEKRSVFYVRLKNQAEQRKTACLLRKAVESDESKETGLRRIRRRLSSHEWVAHKATMCADERRVRLTDTRAKLAEPSATQTGLSLIRHDFSASGKNKSASENYGTW